MKFRTRRAAFGPAATVTALFLSVASAPSAEPMTDPAATPFDGVRTVGALFPSSAASEWHTCTGSVVTSTSGDTVLTAAHCVAGSGTSFSFVPGYHDGVEPYGVWHVTKTYIDPHWMTSRDPAYDVAVLKIAPQTISGHKRTIQSVVGAGYRLGTRPVRGSYATIPGYNAGISDRPVTCTARIGYTLGYPRFVCDDYTDGVSGSPFVERVSGVNYVTGVIGGLHQGGCDSSTSYSAPFGSAERTLLSRAEQDSAADNAPSLGSDGC